MTASPIDSRARLDPPRSALEQSVEHALAGAGIDWDRSGVSLPTPGAVGVTFTGGAASPADLHEVELLLSAWADQADERLVRRFCGGHVEW